MRSAAIEPAFAAGLARHGYPEPRISATRARDDAAHHPRPAGERRSRRRCGVEPAGSRRWRRRGGRGSIRSVLAAAPDDLLRTCGLSRQKAGYVKQPGRAGRRRRDSISRRFAVRTTRRRSPALVRIKGIGRWSAEIYLLFAEGRGDIWPAGDLAVQEEVGQLLGLHETRPSEKAGARTGRGVAPPPQARRRSSPGTITAGRLASGQSGQDAGVMAGGSVPLASVETRHIFPEAIDMMHAFVKDGHDASGDSVGANVRHVA